MKTQTVINNLLNGTITTKVCRICLEEAEYLADYDEPQTFLGDFYSKSHKLGEIIAELTKNTLRGYEIDFSMKICESCVGNAVSAFLFIKQYEVATQSIIFCVEHLHSHVEKVEATDVVSLSDESIVFVMPYKNIYDFIEDKVVKEHEKEFASNNFVNAEYPKDNEYKIKDVEIKFENKNELILKEKINDSIVEKIESFKEVKRCNEKLNGDSDKFECIICTLKFPTRCKLNLHKRWHKENDYYSCKLCGCVLGSLAALNLHTLSHNEKTEDYLCTVCGKSFHKERLLKAHLQFHGEKKYNCRTCEKSFQTNALLSKHERLKHAPKTLSICDLCGKLCSSNERLRIHRESHVTKICPHCGKNLFYKRTYKHHVLRCSGILSQPEAIYECDYCGGTWKSKQQLSIHIFGKHMHYKPFMCEICDKRFSTKNLLKGHSIVHTRERLWVCDICSNRFVNKKALRIHRRLHTGEKPYECEVCAERFICPTRRIMHIRRKHMERSLACNICGIMFHTNSNLTSHIKKVHNTIEKEKTESEVENQTI